MASASDESRGRSDHNVAGSWCATMALIRLWYCCRLTRQRPSNWWTWYCRVCRSQSFTAGWKLAARERSARPTGLVAGESPVGVVDGDGVAILEPVWVNDNVGSALMHLARKEDAGVAMGQHQIGQHPGWGFDVRLEPQVAPVLTPVVP